MTVDLLGEILRDAPRLPGAKCIDRWGLFDPPEPGTDPQAVKYAQDAALTLCRECPALAGCTSWVDSIPPRQRPTGVVAGRVFITTGSRNVEISCTTTRKDTAPCR